MDANALTRTPPVERNALLEFADAFADRAPQIEQDVGRLRRAPEDRAAIADLFRAIHNIKGDAALCRLEAPVAVVHPLETVLARIRGGELNFTELFAELVLVALDRLELLIEALIEARPPEGLELPALVAGLERVAAAAAGEFDDLAAAAIERVTGFPPVAGVAGMRGRGARGGGRDVQAAANLRFFRTLALLFESRSPLLRGRTGRVLRLALETNAAAGRPVDAEQLEAAVYMHDVGMMFLPEAVWLKVGPLSAEDRAALAGHPGWAAGLMQRMPGWETATEIVLQHHEMPGGGGYPGRLKAGAIAPGAGLLAIVDAFEAVMLKHASRGRNRSLLRAVAEINANQQQFAPEWVAPFNQVIRRILEASPR